MPKLSVNINKFATLRNSRGGNNPNILKIAQDCERFGAQGVTVHPRPDERHIRYQDVIDLKPLISTELNIEGRPTDKFIQLVLDVKPAQVTLVPDEENTLTSNAGWNTLKYENYLKRIVSIFKEHHIRTSIFIDPIPEMVEGAKKAGADRIELYTEAFATGYYKNKEIVIAPYQKTAYLAGQLGIGVNAGHDLDLVNLRYLNEHIPNLLEVSIGHALVCDALYLGLENSIQQYLRQLM